MVEFWHREDMEQSQEKREWMFRGRFDEDLTQFKITEYDFYNVIGNVANQRSGLLIKS